MATWLQINSPNTNTSYTNVTVYGEISGSTAVISSVTGSLSGTSSYSILSETASYSENSLSSSFAITSAYALNAISNAFPFTGSAEISGSLTVIGPVTSTTGYTGSLFGTSSWANNVISSSYAITASQAVNSVSASQAQNSVTASYASNALSASFSISASQAQNTVSSSFAISSSQSQNSISASYSINSLSASFATSASQAVTASYVISAVSSSFSSTASSADSFIVRGTLTAQTIVVQTITSSIDIVTGSTQFGTLLTNTHTFTGSVRMTGSLSAVNATITGSLFGTSSWSNNSISSSQAQNAITASYVLNAVSSSVSSTASYVLNAISSSFATSASQAQNAITASYSLNTLSSSFAISASQATTSSYSFVSISSSFATSASQAINAVTASYVLNAISSSVSLTSSRIIGGSSNYIPIWNTINSLSSSVLYQSASNIGVDNINPLYKLHFAVGNGGIAMFQQDSKHAIVTNGTLAGTEYHYGPGTVYGFVYAHAAGLHVRSMDNVSLVLGTNNTERVRITGEGLTGYGTTAPTARLHISGAVSERLLLVSASSGPALFVSGNRSVGIGMTNPSVYGGHQTLHIGGAESGRGLIEFGRGSVNNGPLIYSNNDDSLAVYGNGGVNIGAKLDVIGNTIISGSLKISNNNYNLTIDSDGNGPTISTGDRAFTILGQSNAGYIYNGAFSSVARWGINTTDVSNHVLNVNGALNHFRGFNRQTNNYTLALSDAGKIIEMNSSTANTVTIPTNLSIPFPSGSFIDVIQEGSGQTSFVTSSGVTVRSIGGKLKIEGQYGVATLVKKGGDEWYLYGDIIV